MGAILCFVQHALVRRLVKQNVLTDEERWAVQLFWSRANVVQTLCGTPPCSNCVWISSLWYINAFLRLWVDEIDHLEENTNSPAICISWRACCSRRDVLRWGRNIDAGNRSARRRAGGAVYNSASSLETLVRSRISLPSCCGRVCTVHKSIFRDHHDSKIEKTIFARIGDYGFWTMLKVLLWPWRGMLMVSLYRGIRFPDRISVFDKRGKARRSHGADGF